MSEDYIPDVPEWLDEPEEDEEDDYWPDTDVDEDEPFYIESDTWRDEYEDFATEYCD